MVSFPDRRELGGQENAHTLCMLVNHLLQFELAAKGPPRQRQAAGPGQVGADLVVLVEIGLGEASVGVVRVGPPGPLDEPPDADALGYLALDDAAPSLNPGHLVAFGDPDELVPLGEVDQHPDAAGEAGLRVRDAGWVVGNEATQAELAVLLQAMEELEANGRGIAVGCRW